MQIDTHRAAGGFHPGGSTHVDVLADLGHQLCPPILQGPGEVVCAFRQRSFRRLCHEGNELLVFCREIRLDVDFDDGGSLAVSRCGDAEQPFGGGAVGLLGRLGTAFPADDGNGLFHLPAGFRKCLLAVAKADSGAFPQFLDQLHVRGGHRLDSSP